jgi:hypothetical protein
MDVHKESISIAVMNSAGKIVMECVIETKASVLLQFFNGLRGDVRVTFEEGTWAAWLYDLLKPRVSEVVVCNPRKNALLKDGSKSDRIDARKLAELLRGNHLKPVYHGEHGLRTLKELGRSYLTITKDVTRVMNRLKALYRGWGIPCAGHEVYVPRHRSDVGVPTAKLVVVVHLNAGVGQERLHRLQITVRHRAPAMQQQHLRLAGPEALGPNLVLAADHRDHENACHTNARRRIDRCNCSSLRTTGQRSRRRLGLQQRGQHSVGAERSHRRALLKELSPIHRDECRCHTVRRVIFSVQLSCPPVSRLIGLKDEVRKLRVRK